MNRAMMRIRALYGEMGQSEKKVADFLLGHEGTLPPYAIRELAAVSQSSEATIVRFSRRLGYGGYRELILALASAEKEDITPYISPDDGCFDIFRKLCNDAYLSLERTKSTLSPESLDAASEKIAAADRIVFIGLGSSATVAAEAANKLLRAGRNSASYPDSHMQMVAVSRLQAGDVLIGVSHSGASKDIVDAMKIARTRGAVTVAVTSRERSPMAKQADILLLTDTDEVRHFSQGFASHLSRQLVLDTLVYRVAQRNEAQTEETLDETELSLLSKRIPEENPKKESEIL